MKKTILKNTHYAIGLPVFSAMGFLTTDSTHTVTRRVKFDANCAYILHSMDQKDWNKIFGVKFGINGIHENSLRFGWRYNSATQKIELCTIIYKENSEPERKEIVDGELDLNQWATLKLTFTVKEACITYTFYLNKSIVRHGSMPLPEALMYWGSGFYFGGNRKAPHKMTANIEKV